MGQTACWEEGVGRCANAGCGATVGNDGWDGAVKDAAPKVGVVVEEMWNLASVVLWVLMLRLFLSWQAHLLAVLL